MHKIIATLLGAACFLTPGGALAASRTYSVTDFDRVQVDGPYEVVLTTGRSSSAKASGSQDALDRLSVEVQGRTLKIRRNQSNWGGSQTQSSGPVSVQISTQDLVGATVNGSGALTIDKARGLRLDLIVSGSGRIAAPALAVDNLSVGLIGSGGMTLGGTAKSARIEAHGSAEVAAETLIVANAVVIGDTAGSIRFSATETANVTALATGDIDVSGKAACQVKANGTGEVHCGRLR